MPTIWTSAQKIAKSKKELKFFRRLPININKGGIMITKLKIGSGINFVAEQNEDVVRYATVFYFVSNGLIIYEAATGMYIYVYFDKEKNRFVAPKNVNTMGA